MTCECNYNFLIVCGSCIIFLFDVIIIALKPNKYYNLTFKIGLTRSVAYGHLRKTSVWQLHSTDSNSNLSKKQIIKKQMRTKKDPAS